MIPASVLDRVLARYPASLRPLSPPAPLGNAGGQSGSRLWRFWTGRGPYVVRAWPVDGPPAGRIREIHGWLQQLSGLDFIPVPEGDRFGETVQLAAGHCWEVSPWMPGASDPARPPRPARLRAAFVALGAFHQALGWHATEGPSPNLRRRLADTEGLVQGGLDTLSAAVAGSAADDPRRGPARHWIDLARTVAPRLVEPLRASAAPSYRLQPCLRDARPEHFLFEGDRVSGLVDFGAMGLEHVASDLARLLSEWVGSDRPARASALEAYAGVRPLDETDSALIALFEASALLLGGGRWIRWHFVEGRPFDDPNAVAQGLERGVDRLARLAFEQLREWGSRQ
jgi:homoserine kinase type II